MSVDFNPSQNNLNTVSLNKTNSVGFGKTANAKATSKQANKDTYEKKSLSTGAKIGIGAAVVATLLGIVSAVKCHKEGNWKKFGEYLLPWKWGKNIKEQKISPNVTIVPRPPVNCDDIDPNDVLARFERHYRNDGDYGGNTRLHYAAGSAEGIETLAEVLKRNPDNINAFNENDLTPLAAALQCENIKQAEFLVRNGADPFIENKSKETPLDYADKVDRATIQAVIDELGLKPPKKR